MMKAKRKAKGPRAGSTHKEGGSLKNLPPNRQPSPSSFSHHSQNAINTAGGYREIMLLPMRADNKRSSSSSSTIE